MRAVGQGIFRAILFHFAGSDQLVHFYDLDDRGGGLGKSDGKQLN